MYTKDFFKDISMIMATGALMSMISCQDSKQTKEKPNILFIMSDDHANKAISSYGYELIQTPNIDRLASEGVRFNNAFVTNSISAPSRAVILTGKYSHLNGVTNNYNRFDSSQVTFPKILQNNGYETALVGKWHLKTQPTGFDYWNVLPGQGQYYNPGFIRQGKDTSYQGYVTEIITDLALEWLGKRNSEKPFLLLVQHKAPHRNWMPALSTLDSFENKRFPLPPTYFDDYEGRKHLKHQQLTIADHMNMLWDLKVPCDTCPVAEINKNRPQWYKNLMNRFDKSQRKAWHEGYKEEIQYFRNHNLTGKELDKWKYQRYMEDYLRCIISVDQGIGKILDYLDAHNLAENTLVIYTSDQGFFLGEHGLFDKRYMYEESFKTPLLMRYPDKVQPGRKIDKMVQNLDIAPTILDFTGVSIPENIQGHSMKYLMTNDNPTAWKDQVYYHFTEAGWGVAAHYGIRTPKYKLIHFYDPVDQWELYDLEKDPHEMMNLYNDPTYQEAQKRLKNKLKALQNKYKDPIRKQLKF